MKITGLAITVVEVPLRPPVAPYSSHIRTSSATRSAIVRVDTDAGLVGWGEYNVNFREVSARRTAAQVTEWLVGRDAGNIARLHEEWPFALEPPFPLSVKSGVEIALWDIKAQAAGVPLAVLLGGTVREEVELAACMGIVPYERAGEIATEYVERGFTTLKTKAGKSPETDLELVRGVRDAVGDQLKLRIDPNRSYAPQVAADLARRLEEYGLEYFEQPIPAEPLSDARWLRQQSRTPIALNESVTDPASVIAIIKEDAADVVLPDTVCDGGILPSMIIGWMCHAAGIPCVMHCGHDLGPKTAAMVHVAAACPAYSLANDSTYYALENDVTLEPLPIVRGRIRVPAKPGLGVAGDPEQLARYAIDC
ncbi:MAG: mandelate racemase/muconate lactonizing enzyme family protein [Planctomycetales bacterium]